MREPLIAPFFEPITKTISYVVYDQVGGHAAIIDPVLDFEANAGRISHTHANKLCAFIDAQKLRVDWILETHAHADHLSAAFYIQQTLGGRIAMSERIIKVQALFQKLFNREPPLAADGRQFDYLFADDETFSIGQLNACALAVPGHTPADTAYRIGSAVFVGDSVFMPDVGSARCDFPGGDAASLYRSVQRLFALPPATRLFMCHDYPPENRAPHWECSIAEQRAHNIHLNERVSEADFVAMRNARDAHLHLPTLILPAIQVNINGGRLPAAESNGICYLKLPLNQL